LRLECQVLECESVVFCPRRQALGCWRKIARSHERANIVGRPSLVKWLDGWALELRLDCQVLEGVRVGFCPRRQAPGCWPKIARSHERANVVGWQCLVKRLDGWALELPRDCQVLEGVRGGFVPEGAGAGLLAKDRTFARTYECCRMIKPGKGAGCLRV
jgi:hypothetical protein